MLHLLVAILIGFIAYWLSDNFLPPRPNRHTLAVVIGLVIGVLYYVSVL